MRIARTSRLDEVARLDVRANPWDVWGTDELKRYTWWIAWTDDDKPAAFAGARVTESGEGYLAWANVLRAYRGAGLQKRLIRARCAWLRREGCAWAVTYTAHDNVPSMRSLIACGFLPYDPDYAWVGRDWMYWHRRL